MWRRQTRQANHLRSAAREGFTATVPRRQDLRRPSSSAAAGSGADAVLDAACGSCRQPSQSLAFTVSNGTRGCVRFWERNGSGGTLSGAGRSGYPARPDAADVRERRTGAGSPGCAQFASRGRDGAIIRLGHQSSLPSFRR